jgi:hypothetical protein
MCDLIESSANVTDDASQIILDHRSSKTQTTATTPIALLQHLLDYADKSFPISFLVS